MILSSMPGVPSPRQAGAFIVTTFVFRQKNKKKYLLNDESLLKSLRLKFLLARRRHVEEVVVYECTQRLRSFFQLFIHWRFRPGWYNLRIKPYSISKYTSQKFNSDMQYKCVLRQAQDKLAFRMTNYFVHLQQPVIE